MSTTYQDGVTPLDAAHMNALQQKVEKGANGGYPALSAAGFVIAPAGLQFGTGSAFDSPANGAIHTDSDLKVGGQIYGSQYVRAFAGAASVGVILGYMGGPASAIQFGPDNGWDTNLYRASANQLKTDGQFSSGQDIVARQGDPANQAVLGYVNGHGGILLGSAADTNLYRAAAGTLQTDGALTVAQGLLIGNAANPGYAISLNYTDTGARIWLAQKLASDAYNRFAVYGDGTVKWGAGNNPTDTNLYRSAAGYLGHDNNGLILYHGDLITYGGTGLFVHNPGGLYMDRSDAFVYFGPSQDTKLYRSGTGTIAVDQNFLVGGSNPSAGLYFGSAGDTYIQRTSPGKINVNGVPAGVSPIVGIIVINANGTLKNAYGSGLGTVSVARTSGQATGLYDITWTTAIGTPLAHATPMTDMVSVQTAALSTTSMRVTCGVHNVSYVDTDVVVSILDPSRMS